MIIRSSPRFFGRRKLDGENEITAFAVILVLFSAIEKNPLAHVRGSVVYFSNYKTPDNIHRVVGADDKP